MDWRPVGEALRRSRRAKDLTQAAVAERLGVSSAAVSNWENGKDLSTDRLFALKLEAADIYDVSEVTCYLNFRELPAPGKSVGLVTPADLVAGLRTSSIKFWSNFSCGDSSFALEIADRANSPLFSPGDYVVIDPSIQPIPEDMVLVLVEAKTSTRFGQFVAGDDKSRFKLRPLNDAWPVESLGNAGTEIIGVMTEHTRPRQIPLYL